MAVVLAIALFFAEAALSQSHEPRLIPLFANFPLAELDFSGFEVATDSRTFTEGQEVGDIKLGTGKSGGGIDDRFAVYGRAIYPKNAGVAAFVENYRYIPYADLRENLPTTAPDPNPHRLPDLEKFFDFGGTLELVTTDFDLGKYDIVISELLWGIDKGPKDEASKDKESAQLNTQHSQWIELYNTTDNIIDIAYDTTTSNGDTKLYLLFTPFVSYPDRDIVQHEGDTYKVLDAISNLLFGRWELPGKSGKRPTTAFVSAYRNIEYGVVENENLPRDTRLAGIPFGSYQDSWEKTPDGGRRNTELRIIEGTKVVELPYIATPGARHVPEVYIESLDPSDVDSDAVVINEVRNDTSRDNIDWIELKNVGSSTIDLETWELSIVTGVGEDEDLVDLPRYKMAKGEILLILNQHSYFTNLAEGIDIKKPEEHRRLTGLTHKYFVSEALDLPETKKFTLLLRSENDQNGKDRAIEDYAGNAFFSDDLTTQFWPRLAQKRPSDVADFGDNSFASRDQAWARIRYQENDGHHKDAWDIVGTQGGIGYDPNTDLALSPGTPGYENTALKTQLENKDFPASDVEYDDGEISISEIMSDPGPNGNRVQWIELYNSSLTQAINLKGWELEIHNLEDEARTYIEGSFEFEDAIILPNQTLLLVSESAATDVPSNRVYDLYRRHRRELGLTRWPRLLLSPTAFYLKLTDPANPNRSGDDIVVDEVGNLKVVGGTRSKEWDLPKISPDRRRSIVRLYGKLFKPDDGGLDGKPSPPDNGLSAEGWRRSTVKGISLSFYGARDDLASPGSRLGGPLPVALSSFRPVRMETGEVRIRWRTESELDNAGFNILRGETRDGDFTVINLKGIIPGHGTSSEQHLYSYTDTTARSDVIYYYCIEDVSFDGVRQTLATVRLKGDISAAGKLTITWGDLKARE